MKKSNLTKEELKELIGGQLSLQSIASQDVDNNNSYSSCSCSYNNRSVISNTNSVTTCICKCTK